MRKANFPRLSLPPCDVHAQPLHAFLGADLPKCRDRAAILGALQHTRPPKTNRPADYRLKLTLVCDTPYVYDDLREQWLLLTPEEWVRQHFVAHLIRDLGYPPELMMNEVALRLGTVDKRIDSVVYSRRLGDGHLPRMAMIVEYKAPHIRLSPEVLEQALRYNYATHASYLALSNGLEHQVYHIDYERSGYEVLPHIPPYSALKDI